MNRVALLIPLLLSLALSAAAQAPRMQTTPLAGTGVLRDAPDKYNARVTSLDPAPEPDGGSRNAEYRAMKARVEQQFPRRRVPKMNNAKTTAVPMPVVVKAFIPDSISGIPPDNYLATNNDNDAVSVINGFITVATMDSGLTKVRKELQAFTAPVGLGNPPLGPQPNSKYDPKILYDQEANRFVAVILNGVDVDNWIILAFSQSSDPGGAWNFYKLYGDYAGDSLWFDYPTVALTHDEFFLTGNKLVFGDRNFKTAFRKSVIYQFRKSDGYAGATTLRYRLWDSVNYGGAPIRNIFPVKGGSGIMGPEQYFLSLRNMASTNDSVFLLKIADTAGAPGNAVTITAMKSNLVYGFPPDGRQPNTHIKMQTNDARVLGAYAEGGEIQFVSTTVVPASGADGIYHGTISNYATSPAVQASYITVDSMDFAYPNISFAGTNGGLNTSIISFDYSGPYHFPGVGAVMWDGIGHSPLLELKKGDSSIRYVWPITLDTIQRWGDYTGSQPQWNMPGHIWVSGMYGKRDRRYSTWMAQLRSPFVPGVGVSPLANEAPHIMLYPNPAMQYIRLRFSLKEEANLQFRIYTITGSLVDNLLSTRCHKGENELQFNTGPLAPGQYLLKGTGTDGRNLVTKTFVKQ